MWKKYQNIFSDGIILNTDNNMLPDQLDNLEERFRNFIELIDHLSQSEITMIPYFVSYDISNNRVRTHIMNYLLQKGMTRLQKSVYFGQSSSKVFNEIKKSLIEINSSLDSEDSIFVLPVNRDICNRMNFIGMDLAFEVSRPHQHTLFV